MIQCSEYIYTSWKNGGVGSGFSAFSKSIDVTSAEADEIIDKLSYVKPRELPDRPTPIEIEELFPRSQAFFRLKSGRYCIAQAVYVGKDYTSDANARWANYMIHAYITDNIDGISPAGYLDRDVFKTFLTEEEQEYSGMVNSDSVSLPIPEPSTFAPQALSDVMISGDGDDFYSFMQSVFNRLDNDSCILVGMNDRERIETWLMAASAVLPSRYYRLLTYGTYQLYKIGAMKINFMYNSGSIDKRSEQRADPNGAILLFDNGELSERPALCRYLAEHKAAAEYSSRDAFKLKQGVDAVLDADTGISLDEALKVHRFLERDADYFKSAKELGQVVLTALSMKKLRGVSEIAFDVIKSSTVREEEKRELFFIGDVFDRLEPAERKKVRQEYFTYCYNNAQSADMFVAACEANPAVSAGYTPLTEDFFAPMLNAGGEQRDKAVRFIIELGETHYPRLDGKLRELYFDHAHEAVVSAAEAGNYASAEKTVKTLAANAEIDGEDRIREVARKLSRLPEKFGKSTSFVMALLGATADDREAYWEIFRKAYCVARSSSTGLQTFLRRYIAEHEASDKDIAQWAKKCGFEEVLPFIAMFKFIDGKSNDVRDFSEFFNQYLGAGRFFEADTSVNKTYFGKLQKYIMSAVDDIELVGKKDGEAAETAMLYSLIDDFVALLSPARMTDRLAKWLNDILFSGRMLKNVYNASCGKRGLLQLDTVGLYEHENQYPILMLYVDILKAERMRDFDGGTFFYLRHYPAFERSLEGANAAFFAKHMVEVILSDVAASVETFERMLMPLINMRYDVATVIKRRLPSLSEGVVHELLAWYVDVLEDLRVSQAEEFEERLIFPLLETHRKLLGVSFRNVSPAYRKRYRAVIEYLDTVTYNMLGKAKRR